MENKDRKDLYWLRERVLEHKPQSNDSTRNQVLRFQRGLKELDLYWERLGWKHKF